VSDDYTEPEPRDDYDGIVDLIRAAAQDLASLTPEARREALTQIDAELAQYRD
jgi:hypothetical protein